MYWQQTDLRDVASLCFFSLQFVTMSQLFAVPQLFAERPLFLRERAAGVTCESARRDPFSPARAARPSPARRDEA